MSKEKELNKDKETERILDDLFDTTDYERFAELCEETVWEVWE